MEKSESSLLDSKKLDHLKWSLQICGDLPLVHVRNAKSRIHTIWLLPDTFTRASVEPVCPSLWVSMLSLPGWSASPYMKAVTTRLTHIPAKLQQDPQNLPEAESERAEALKLRYLADYKLLCNQYFLVPVTHLNMQSTWLYDSEQSLSLVLIPAHFLTRVQQRENGSFSFRPFFLRSYSSSMRHLDGSLRPMTVSLSWMESGHG